MHLEARQLIFSVARHNLPLAMEIWHQFEDQGTIDGARLGVILYGLKSASVSSNPAGFSLPQELLNAYANAHDSINPYSRILQLTIPFLLPGGERHESNQLDEILNINVNSVGPTLVEKVSLEVVRWRTKGSCNPEIVQLAQRLPASLNDR